MPTALINTNTPLPINFTNLKYGSYYKSDLYMKRLSFFTFFACSFAHVNAQLCTGSLGEPVVNITFGSGSDPGPELPRGQTSYTYSTSQCPSQGAYSIVNLTFECYDNSWQAITTDNTPNDSLGYYMLVNSESIKATLYVFSVTDLCPNTTYEFSTWVKNALRPTACDENAVEPDLKLTIETLAGNILATYSTGNIQKANDAQWNQYGVLFKTPSTETELVFRISNNSIAGCGNVLALDDITVKPCGSKINAVVASTGSKTVEVCEGANTSFLLSANFGPELSNSVFHWQVKENADDWKDIVGATSKDYLTKRSPSGYYLYRVVVSQPGSLYSPKCRIFSNHISVNIQPPPFIQLTNYVYGCVGGKITMIASGGLKYNWTGPNGFTSTLQRPEMIDVQYSDSGLYKVTGITDVGCQNSDSTLLKVYPNVTATAGHGTFICEGATTTLTAGGGISYRWQPSKGLSNDTIATPAASPQEKTLYVVEVRNQYGCSDTATVEINVWKKPVADAGPDLKTRVGLPVALSGIAKGSDVTWFWTPSNNLSSTLLLNPVTTTPQTFTYTFHVTSSHGCGASADNVVVSVFDKILIPNAFSPNGDGVNDTWHIDPLGLFTEASTEVFNRYGVVVYRSKGFSTAWNGTSNGMALPPGTYFYIIDLKIPKEPKLTGSVTILR